MQNCVPTSGRALAVLYCLLAFAVLHKIAFGQAFTTIHHFSALSGAFPGTNSDGTSAESGVVASNGVIYGAASSGGQFANGTLFRMNTDGNAFTTLHHFTTTGDPATNSDGAHPKVGLVLDGDTLFGGATYGGTSGNGALFSVKTSGSPFLNIHNFSSTAAPNAPNADGAGQSAVVPSGTLAYGTAFRGGDGGAGTIFLMNKSGSAFIPLFSFDAVPNGVNASGAGPNTPILHDGGTLYGTTQFGGAGGNGVVFRIGSDGSAFTNLHNFSASFGDTNPDGIDPHAGLIISGGRLYGTALYGGIGGNGVVFAVNVDGSDFQTLHSFGATFGSLATNLDGANPYSGLILVGDILYGTTAFGGVAGNGTVYGVRTNGSGFFVLHQFSALTGSASTNLDGATPFSELCVDGSYLYGTAANGGLFGEGTVFKISIPAILAIERKGPDVLVSWPTNVSGYTLENTTNLVTPAWNALPTPSVSGTWNVVTNRVSGTTRAFRLRKP